MKKMHKYVRGVTLVELMIVILVLGILVTIAYPNYRQYAARAKRTEARAALLQIATNQERFYLQNNTYTNNLANLGFPPGACYQTSSGSYSVCIPNANANDFTATATYLNADNEAGVCASFSIDGRGAKTSQPEPDCWTRTR